MTKLWKWSKRLLWVLAGLFILLILSVSILVYLINSEAFLEKQIQKQLGMSSQVGELDVSIFSGTVSISETRVGPEDNPAITFDKLTAEISYSGLFSSILIDSIALDKAVIRYPFDYELSEANEVAEESEQGFFFERLSVSEIRIKDSDFVFDDEVKLEATGINLVITDLPVAERSIFLFSQLNEFFVESNTRISADIDQLHTDKSSLNKVKLQARISDQNIIIEKLSSTSADIIISVANSGSGGNNNSNVQETELLTLPFNSLLVEAVDIGTTHFKLEGQHQLSVNDIQATFSQLVLVKDKKPLWTDWEDFYLQQNSQYTLSSKELDSEKLSYKKLQMEGELADSSFEIKQLTLATPTFNYHADAQATDTDSSQSEDASSEDNVSPENSTDFHLPFARVHLNQLTITNGSLDLQLSDSYKAQSINAEVQQLPVILEHKLVIANPELWKQKTNAKIEASDVSLPQAAITKISTDIESESGSLLISPLSLEGVALKLDLAAVGDAADNTSGSNDTLPFNQITIKDAKVKQLDAVAKLTDGELTVDNASIEFDVFPLMADKVLFNLDALDQLDMGFRVTTDSFESKQLAIRSLSAVGSIADSRLIFETLTNQSGRLTLDLDSPSQQKATSEQAVAAQRLPIKSVVINSLNLRNFNGDIVNMTDGLDEDGNEARIKEIYKITDVDLLASNLSLVKNNQLISEWFDSQLENAFKSIELKVAQIQQDEDTYSNFDIKAVQAARTITVKPLTVKVNEADLSADWSIDLAQPGYASHFEFDFQNLDLEKLVRPDNESSINLRGKLDGLADLNFTGLKTDDIYSSLSGQILLTNNEPVQLVNLNVNKVLERFLESQEFGLLDIGGFVLAGPAGLLLSQGVSMQGVLSNLGADQGNTMFGQVHVDMTIDKGVLKTRDVAASTQYYRFAFDGNIDLSIMAFNDFEFMILNKEGCKEYSQTLNGSLSSPEIETFRTAFDAVTGSVVGLLKTGVGLLTGGYCDSVYDGKVTHPEKGVEIPHPELKKEEPEVENSLSPESEIETSAEAETNDETESGEPTQ
ncbi:MAG TPA: AsmA-like C-terminal region-containing protein [Kangiella sp.]